MKKIIMDTNFLLIPAQFKVDVFSELERIMQEPYEIYVLERSIEELHNIVKRQKGKNRDSAKLALQIIKGRVKILAKGEGHVDDIIVNISDKDTIVCTQDKELSDRLKEKGVKLIKMKQKKYLFLS